MGVNSYAEIYTTMIGWHLYGVIWDVLSATGIIFLPFLGMLVDHWREAFIDSDESNGASAGLRALEVDLYVGIFVLFFACVPTSLTSLNRSDVFYAPLATSANPSPVTATGNSPQSTFGSTFGATPSVVNVPLWWYAVMGISSGVTSAIIAGSNLNLDDLRKVAEHAKRASIDDPQLRYEVLRFYNECYIPARSKFLREPASRAAKAAIATYGADDPEWMGSHAFRADGALYGGMFAEREVPGWAVDPVRDADQATAPIPPEWGRPTCKEWWEGGATTGLRPKIIDAVRATSKLDSLVATFGASLSTERRNDLVAQTALDKTRLVVLPDPYVPVNNGFVKQAASSTTTMISGFITTVLTWLAVSVLKPSLPYLQALLLLGIYTMLPFVLVLSRYSVQVLVIGAMAIFTIRFWSFLWFVTDVLDDKLAMSIYPDANSMLSALSSFYRIGDPTKAMLLNLVVMSLYLALPALWSGLMAMVGMRVGGAISAPFDDAVMPIRSAGHSAGSIAGKAAELSARGLARGARAIRSRFARGRE